LNREQINEWVPALAGYGVLCASSRAGSTSDQELKSEYQESKLAVNSTKVMEPSAFLVKLDREADVWLAFRDGRGGPCNSESVDGPLEYVDHDAVRSPNAGVQKDAVSKPEKFNAEPMIAVNERRVAFPQKPLRVREGDAWGESNSRHTVLGNACSDIPESGAILGSLDISCRHRRSCREGGDPVRYGLR
jgi:hypothetical protein